LPNDCCRQARNAGIEEHFHAAELRGRINTFAQPLQALAECSADVVGLQERVSGNDIRRAIARGSMKNVLNREGATRTIGLPPKIAGP
jgi:hypothetical protein